MSGLGRLLRGENEVNFVKWWRRGLVLSAALIVVSLASLGIRGLNLTVEFTGGVSAEIPVSGVSVDEARSALTDAGLGSARVQLVTDVTGSETLRVQTSAEGDNVEEQLRTIVSGLAAANAQDVSITAVSASWGADVTAQALRALVFFLLAILVYLTIRLEFRMAIGAIVATAHDILITVGIYSLFQFEVSPSTIIAFLMVLGYSIYDTVVIYDKVKTVEAQVGIANRLTYTAGAERAMNLVLLRSLNTSITSLLPVLALIIVGANLLGALTLNQFAVALAVGLVVGTYSSIMIAAPTVVVLKEREPRFRQLHERIGGPSLFGRSTAASGSAVAAAPVGARTPSGEEPAAGSRPAASKRPAPSGAIPPRPRKRSGNRNPRR
jgi:preprotein translocase subunit SecF